MKNRSDLHAYVDGVRYEKSSRSRAPDDDVIRRREYRNEDVGEPDDHYVQREVRNLSAKRSRYSEDDESPRDRPEVSESQRTKRRKAEDEGVASTGAKARVSRWSNKDD